MLAPDQNPTVTAIQQAHQLYCQLTGQTLRLGYDRERMWLDLVRAGYTQQDLRTVVTYLQREIRAQRRNVGALERLDGRFKLHPIVDWTDRDIGAYLRRHHLPYHPLWERGYVSIGDWTTTRSLADAGSEQQTRFFGLRRECGLHGLAG